MAARRPPARGRAGTRAGARRERAGGLALFGEVVIVGAVVALLAVPLVTLLPALAAGVAHLRRQLTGHSVRMADLLRDFAAAWRALWRLSVGALAAALVLLWNVSLAQAGLVPGAGGLRVLTWALLLAWAVLLLRVAAGWRPGAEGGAGASAALLRGAAGAAVRDPGGSALLAAGVLLCGTFVWMLPPLLLLAGGLLALASVAVESRAARGLGADDDGH
ncbi:hypothetical protein SAMN06297387_101219 [Streptomyces zhaozhouensis]|uniref:DUF624 domain-containing protein n=1 Tax=Streptomyces zhaozhouensis TaxID=1300267 RepID=A0A286DIY7_9ACTN|nr:hypothetical protein [Streptomyces zhaozhouensis]SOD58579.1 hypothetical protein SAMN06297387_101219 [Streptomyces zhaozhouensis]